MKTSKDQKLTRSTDNRILGGVCGGLAVFFNFDATLIRLIFVFVTLFGGSGILMYLILWIIIPVSDSAIDQNTIRENIDDVKNSVKSAALRIKGYSVGNHPKKYFGIFLLVIGIILLFENLGILHSFFLIKFWPVLLIILAISILVQNK